MTLIDKAALLNRIATEVHYDSEHSLEMYAKLLSEINDAPTVDAEPVRHGHWLKNGDRYCECSVCHHEGNMSGADNYCRNCGAKMDDACGRWHKQGDEYRCSECGDTTIVAYKNCPNCGAEMDEVRDE